MVKSILRFINFYTLPDRLKMHTAWSRRLPDGCLIAFSQVYLKSWENVSLTECENWILNKVDTA